ncbi:hypothetical protein [Xanthomonas dyei]|uniref:hypothetical protein n=1 Tax=Xanthomonas dyei TaxID=743699 RepID=UPI001EE89E5A|nr:hypothetical protein [Xanthomonas dyei]
MKEELAHLVLKPLTWTLGIGSEASQGSATRVSSMQMTAVARMYALDTTDGLDLTPFTWNVAIDDLPVSGSSSPQTVGMISCYMLVGSIGPAAELTANISLSPDAMRDLVSSAANGFAPTLIRLDVRTKSGETTPEGQALQWDTNNEPEIEIAKVEIFTTRHDKQTEGISGASAW